MYRSATVACALAVFLAGCSGGPRGIDPSLHTVTIEVRGMS